MRLRLEELCRLPLDHVEVRALIESRVAGVHQLQHFPFGDHIGRVGKNRQYAHPLDADHQLKSARIQKIADEYRRRIAERRIGCGVAAP